MNTTAEDAEQFNITPNFKVSHFDTLEKDPVPIEAEKAWEKVSSNKKIILISDDPNRRFIYMYAKERILSSSTLLNDSWPLSYLVLAEAHFWLGSNHETLRLLTTLQSKLPHDPELCRIIGCIDKIMQLEQEEDETYHNTKGSMYTCEFSSPFVCPTVEFDKISLQEAVTKWKSLKGKEQAAVEQFIRHACISTNVIENVFELEGNSWSRLIRRGFYANSIEGISKTSKTKKKETVITILKNTQESLHHISNCLDDISTFNVDFFKKIHATLLKNDNFESHEEDDYEIIRLITTGELRKVACITHHNNETEVTQYCHHSMIEEEMERYCNHAQQLLSNDQVDPFMKCAWLQWAFLRIHPFEDGNGRVSRIISSIPLYKYDLPPIVVSTKDKHHYFEALHKADRHKDLNPLADFLRISLLKAMEEIEQLPTTETTMSVTTKARKRAPGSRPSSRENSSDEKSGSDESP